MVTQAEANKGHTATGSAEETLNGYPVVGAVRLPPKHGMRPRRAVIVAREDHDDYATAIHCDGDRGWDHGHYGMTWEEALDDLADRAKRG